MVWGVALLPIDFTAQCLLGAVAAFYAFFPAVLRLCNGRASKTPTVFWWLADDQGPPARAGARMPGVERRTNSPAALAGSPLHGLPWRAGIAF